MDAKELNRNQLVELKQSCLEEVLGKEPTWDDLALADEIVSDDYVFEKESGTDFSEDDFLCSANGYC